MNSLAIFAILAVLYTANSQDIPVQIPPVHAGSEGSEFFMGFLRNYIEGPKDPEIDYLQLLVTSLSPAPTAVTISSIDAVIAKTIVTSSSSAIVNVSTSLMVTNGSPSQRHKGLHIVANGSDVSIVAVNVNLIDKDAATTATYNILPHHKEPAEEYEYFAVSVGSPKHKLLSEVLLVGTEDNTTITIYPTHNVLLPSDVQSNNQSTIIVQPGQSHQITLHRLQTLLVTNKGQDLTGTRIVSNKPLSVLSGHECGNVPSDMGQCDHLGVHIPPSSTWGKEFLLIPFLGRPAGQQFKMISAEANTTLKCFCSGVPEVISLDNSGSVYEFHTTSFTSCYLKSDKPLLMVQLGQGLETDGMGDPAMMIVPPMERYTNRVSFIPLMMDGSFSFMHNYINILATSENFDYTKILLDGKPVKADWSMVLGENDTTVAYGCKIPISAGSHIVEHRHPNGRLSVLVYGFDNHPRHGYGFESIGSMKTSFVPVVSLAAEQQTVVREGEEIAIQLERAVVTTTNTTVLLAVANTRTPEIEERVIKVVFAAGESKKTVYIPTDNDDVTGPDLHYSVHIVPTADILLGETTETVITVLDNDAVNIGFTDVSGSLPNLIIELALLQGSLKQGFEIEVSLNLGHLGNGRYNGHIARGQWSMNNRQVSFNSDATHHIVPLDLSRWLPENQLRTEDDNYVLVTLSLTNQNSLILLEPSTLVINLRNSSTTILSPPPPNRGNPPETPAPSRPVAMTTVYLPCPQQTNDMVNPDVGGVMAMDGQSIVIGVVLAFMVILAVSIVIPVVVCLLIHRNRKRGFYDLQSRQV